MVNMCTYWHGYTDFNKLFILLGSSTGDMLDKKASRGNFVGCVYFLGSYVPVSGVLV